MNYWFKKPTDEEGNEMDAESVIWRWTLVLLISFIVAIVVVVT